MNHKNRTWKDNAAEFAALDRGEGWQFAILVACSVEKGLGQNERGSRLRDHEDEKVSAIKFANMAGTSADRVLRYLNAWNAAAEKGWVQAAESLTPAVAHDLTIPDRPWREKDGGVYGDRSKSGGQINNVEQIADKAARDPEYASRLAAAVSPTVVREAITANPDVARAAMDALDKRYEDSPKPIAKAEPDTQSAGVDLVFEFRKLHRGVDQIVQLVNEGKAVVSDDTRDAILREVKWLQTALGYIEDGVASNSLADEIAAFLGAEA